MARRFKPNPRQERRVIYRNQDALPCTTSFYKLPSTKVRWDWLVIANARLDWALYRDNRLDRTLSFNELRRLAYLNDIANAAPATGFGDHIRREVEKRRHER